MLATFLISLFLIGLIFLLINKASLSVITISYLFFICLLLRFQPVNGYTEILLGLFLSLFAIGLIKPLRIRLITQFIFNRIKHSMPGISKTEAEALEAGTVGWEGEIYSGSPNFNRLLETTAVKLTDEEQAFLEGPTKELCRLLNDWEITHELQDLPVEAWDFIKKHQFFGMIIPKKYGGLQFSSTAQVAILSRIYSHSISAATTIAVPNSLGPAELLLKYGTSQQKNYYLPRLANGLEIPCFALTGPYAGSDAASIPDTGIVVEKTVEGKKTLGIVLNWNKRYITLCPVATIMGLAFRLFDPNNYLGKGEDVGITCALIPSETPGIDRGRRHFPLNIAFLNGPTQGKDVFIPMEAVIGGPEMAGQGWRMLMECLSVGRSISLPSSALGNAQSALLTSTAYARIRQQFKTPIGLFEGIKDPLGRIAGTSYMIEAAIGLTTSWIDHGAKPSIAGAIIKYHTTEKARGLGLDCMDIHGGKGICLGPNNYVGRPYQTSPIGITVEGANILTRNLIIFGQGVVRCHPYLYREIKRIEANDLKGFDEIFCGHLSFIFSNFFKSLLYSLTNGYWIKTPSLPVKRYYQLVTYYSTQFALLTDLCLGILGGNIKRKESLSARLGDMVSNLYFISALLKRFHDEGQPSEEIDLLNWSCQTLLADTERALYEVTHNLPHWTARVFLKMILFPYGRRRQKPSDKLTHRIAEKLLVPSKLRDKLTRLVFCEPIYNSPIGRLEDAFKSVCLNKHLEMKIHQAVKSKTLRSLTFLQQIQEALLLDIISKEEAETLKEMELKRLEAISVDDFDHEELSRIRLNSLHKQKKTNHETVMSA